MSWMLIFWSSRYRNDLANVRGKLLGQVIHQPGIVRLSTLAADNRHIDLLISDLKPNDVIVVSAGEQVPADGLVVRGHGLVDERMIKGVHGLSRKRPDDEVLAGSIIELGELHIQVRRRGAETRVAKLAKIIFEATTAPNGSRTATRLGELFAERAVPPTMAMAGLSVLVGDISTAGAILRPDYATGPGVAIPLESLQAIALSLHHGILVRTPHAIEQLATADLLIIEHQHALESTELEIDTVDVFPGYLEHDILRYAATAFSDLDDERATALARACQKRGISRLDLQLAECTADLTFVHENDRIKVGDLGARRSNLWDTDTPEDVLESLMVGVNGHLAGLIHFRRSNHLQAISALSSIACETKSSSGNHHRRRKFTPCLFDDIIRHRLLR